MSNKKKKPENILRRLLNDEGEFAYYTYEQLFGNKPVKIEIILRTPFPDGFSPEQRAALADGLKQTKAKQILLEMVYQENDSELPFLRLMTKGLLHRNTHKLKQHDVQLALLFQKEPAPTLLSELGYQPTSHPGVYQSSLSIFSDLLVIVLSELSNALYNANLKIFARNQQARRDAYNVMLNHGFPNMQPGTRMVLAQIAAMTETEMDNVSREMNDALLAQMGGTTKSGPQDPLASLSPEQVINDVEAFLREQR